MTKMKVESEVSNDKYCDYKDTVCPARCEDNWRRCYWAIYDDELKMDLDNNYCISCDECKQAEVKDEN